MHFSVSETFVPSSLHSQFKHLVDHGIEIKKSQMSSAVFSDT